MRGRQPLCNGPRAMGNNPDQKVDRESYAQGECICREGEFAMCAYIVESGSVDTKKDDS